MWEWDHASYDIKTRIHKICQEQVYMWAQGGKKGREKQMLVDDHSYQKQDWKMLWRRQLWPTSMWEKESTHISDTLATSFSIASNDNKHGVYVTENLHSNQLMPLCQSLTQVIYLIKHNQWCVFDSDGMDMTVLHFQFSIYSGSIASTHSNQENYGVEARYCNLW